MVTPQAPVEVFCSYAHEDETWLQRLEKHLSLLKQQGYISLWHNQLISAGIDWDKEIDTHLETASVILLLVSSDFLASKYCYGREMMRALERQKNGEARVVPILIRSVDLTGAPFAHLQVLPKGAIPVATSNDHDTTLTNVAADIRRIIIEEVAQSSKSALPTNSADPIPERDAAQTEDTLDVHKNIEELPQSLSRNVSTSPSVKLKKRITFIAVPLIGIIILLIVLSPIKQGPPSAPSTHSSSTQTTGSSTTTNTTGPTSNNHTTDITVSAFLTHLCNLLQTGQYPQAFTQLTTTAYQRNNASKGFGFTEFGGVIRCFTPTQANITLPAPLYTSASCLIHFVVKNQIGPSLFCVFSFPSSPAFSKYHQTPSCHLVAHPVGSAEAI